MSITATCTDGQNKCNGSERNTEVREGTLGGELTFSLRCLFEPGDIFEY